MFPLHTKALDCKTGQMEAGERWIPQAGADLWVHVCVSLGRSIEPIHPRHRRVLKVVKPEAPSLPLIRGGDQASLHGIAMHGAELLQALLVGEDFHRIIPRLPDPILRLDRKVSMKARSLYRLSFFVMRQSFFERWVTGLDSWTSTSA
jgi:hypothetical protein